MTVETVTIDRSSEKANPTLEEEAKALGIDTKQIDPTAQEQQATPRPEWLPAKFKTVGDFVKSYEESQKKITELSQNKEQPAKSNEQLPSDEERPEGEVEEEQSAEEQEALDNLAKAGVNVQEMSQRFWENGKLEDSDYETLEKAGYSRQMVDEYAEGQKAIQQLREMTVYAEVGGQQNYAAMLNWGAQNMSEAEVAEFNEAVNSTNNTKIMSAVKGLQARYQAAVGFEPTRPVSGRTKASMEVYESIAQLQVDMKDPRYQKDPAFRARVEQKLGRSDIL